MKRLLLAHDLGTSGNKATLFDSEGNLLASCTVAYETVYSHNTWAEQNPDQWWEAVCRSTRQILKKQQAGEVACVTFSGQMMGCLPVDASGMPLRTHILYCDQRAVTQTEALLERLSAKEIFSITGHRPSPSYAIEKLMWLRDNQPDIYKRTAKMLNAKDYINFRLTGRLVTEYNDASGTNAFNLHTLSWSDKIIDAAGVDREKFPEAVSSVTVIGEVTKEAAEATGLRTGTPVVAGAGDGGCATVGIGSVRPGVTYNYVGSSSWISTTSTSMLEDPEMKNFTWAHPVPGYLQPCGTMQTAGGAYAWLKNELGAYETEEAKRQGKNVYKLMDAAVERSPVGAKGVLFLPYLLGERSPRWNPDAKGAFLGLTLEHTRAEMFRSVLEGITINLGIILDVMKQGADISEMRVIGGGAKGLQWQQIMADVYDMPVRVPRYLEEATSMGAAVIGGVGCGVLDSFDRVEDFIQFTHRVEPIAEHTRIYRQKRTLFDEAYEAFLPLFSSFGSAHS
ncbi:MAG: xylulokinase [Spirochaetales bacterium]|nr:xylulokinase [Spirochaetales bacterium]